MRMLSLLLSCCLLSAAAPLASAADAPDALSHKLPALDGTMQDLSEYRGKVVLLVNVASQCGATPQYAGLQELHEKYGKQGLVVIGFPCNQFGAQEPGTAEEIRSFCTGNYGVTFPLLAKGDVNGAGAAPLYQYLTSEKTNPEHAGKVRWNFEKFLIGRDGQVVSRFGTSVEPQDEELVTAIERALAQPAR